MYYHLFCLYLCVSRTSIVPSKYLMTMMIIVMMIGFYFFARHVSHFLLYPHTVSPQPVCYSLESQHLHRKASCNRAKQLSNLYNGVFFSK